MKRTALLAITLIFLTACATTRSTTAPQATAPAAEQQQDDTTWKQKTDNGGIKQGYEWLIVDDLDWIWSFTYWAAGVW